MHRKSPRRIASAAVITLLSLGVLTACEPPPPPPQLVVTTRSVGPDAAPGDGICEMSTGAADCSLQAALEEGNALGRAAIRLAVGEYTIPSVTITAEVSITGAGDFYSSANAAVVNGGPIEVASNGSLSADDVALNAQLTIDGLFVGRSLYLFWSGALVPQPGPRVRVGVDGVAYLENTIVPHTLDNQGALYNSGVVILNYSTLTVHSLWGNPPEPALFNDGIVHSTASYLDGCSGTPPVSHGYNAAVDDSCAIDAPTDIPFVGLSYRDHPSYLKQYYMPLLSPGSPLLDAVPEGVSGCGTTVTKDMNLQARPYDGNGDGTAACDIGAREEFSYFFP